MIITLINPNIVSQKIDLSGSGIPYMPIGLANLSSYLRSKGHSVHVIDAFGEAPQIVTGKGNYYIQGLSPSKVVERIPPETQAIGFYAHLTVTHDALLEIIQLTRRQFPDCHTMVFENINKVNSYSLRQIYDDFFKLGIDYVVLGYLEKRTHRLLDAIQERASVHGIDGVIARNNDSNFTRPCDFTNETDLDDLPFPAWDLFPLENYWKLGYAHGPLT